MLRPVFATAVSLGAASAASAAIDWHAWAVHEGTISESGGVITAYTPDTPDTSIGGTITNSYQWNKPNPSTRDGAKAFYSTDAFLGQKISDITQITWTVDAGNVGNVYYNIMVEDSVGKKAILIPAGLAGEANQWGSTQLYRLVEPDPGFSVAGADANGRYEWDEVKDLVITTGPFNDQPDTLTASHDYTGNNWAAWADQAAGGDFGWEDDGFLIVFGQSTGTATPTTVISNLTVIPEPASLALLALGGTMLVARRRR